MNTLDELNQNHEKELLQSKRAFQNIKERISFEKRNDDEKEKKIKAIENSMLKGCRMAFYLTLTVMVALVGIRLLDYWTS